MFAGPVAVGAHFSSSSVLHAGLEARAGTTVRRLIERGVALDPAAAQRVRPVDAAKAEDVFKVEAITDEWMQAPSRRSGARPDRLPGQ